MYLNGVPRLKKKRCSIVCMHKMKRTSKYVSREVAAEGIFGIRKFSLGNAQSNDDIYIEVCPPRQTLTLFWHNRLEDFYMQKKGIVSPSGQTVRTSFDYARLKITKTPLFLLHKIINQINLRESRTLLCCMQQTCKHYRCCHYIFANSPIINILSSGEQPKSQLLVADSTHPFFVWHTFSIVLN